MAENKNSVVVLRIRLKFWWMIPMGVKYNNTKFDIETVCQQETRRRRLGTVCASGGPRFQNLSTRKGGGGKAGANPFGENNERRLHGFGAVHKPRGTIMQTEPMLKKHAT